MLSSGGERGWHLWGRDVVVVKIEQVSLNEVGEGLVPKLRQSIENINNGVPLAPEPIRQTRLKPYHFSGGTAFDVKCRTTFRAHETFINHVKWPSLPADRTYKLSIKPRTDAVHF